MTVSENWLWLEHISFIAIFWLNACTVLAAFWWDLLPKIRTKLTKGAGQ